MALEEFSGNAVATTLASGINSGATSLTVNDATGWPAGATAPFVATLDRGTSSEEKVLVGERSGSTFNDLTRGYDGTTAVAHSGTSGTVEHTISAAFASEVSAHVNDDTRDDHSQYLDNTRHDVEARHTFGGALGTPVAPTDIGTSPAAGTGNNPAREDHVHQLASGSIDQSAMFAAGVVDSAAIATDAVGTAEIAANAVGASELADNAVDTAAIADSAVISAKIADGTIVADDIADATVTPAKLAATAYSTYTPAATGTVSNPGYGTGVSRLGRYQQVFATVAGSFIIAFGTSGTSPGSGTLQVSLPVVPQALAGGYAIPVGVAVYQDNAGASFFMCTVEIVSGVMQFRRHDTQTLVVLGGSLNNDTIAGSFRYEAA